MGYFEVLFLIQAAVIIAFIVSLVVKPRLVKAKVSKVIYWFALLFLGSIIVVSTSIPLVYRFTGYDFGMSGPSGVTSTGIVRFGPIPFNVYNDVAATDLCTMINWGNVTPGFYVNRTVYMRNEGNVPMNATITWDNASWVPQVARQYFWLHWDYGQKLLKPSMTRKVVIQIYVYTTINQTVPLATSFSFNFVLTSSA